MLSVHQISQTYSIPEDDVELILMAWDADPKVAVMEGPCWLGGPAKFRIGPRTISPLRALGATSLGYELDRTWTLHRQCQTQACRNLTHYELHPLWDLKGLTEPKDLPE